MIKFILCSWKREIRVKKIENRMKAETWYYTPCGRRMKQFPEIIKVDCAALCSVVLFHKAAKITSLCHSRSNLLIFSLFSCL